MRKLIPLIAFALLIVVPVYAQPKQLKTFDELITALNSGYTVRIVINYAKCKLIADNELQEKSPEAIGGMSIDDYEYFAPNSVRGNENAFVVFSENKLIQNPKGKGFVYNYAKFRVEETGKIKVTVMYIHPATLEVQMSENFFTEFSPDIKESAIKFFANNQI